MYRIYALLCHTIKRIKYLARLAIFSFFWLYTWIYDIVHWKLVVSKFDPRWPKFLNDQQKKGCFNREFKIILKYSEKQKGFFLRKNLLDTVYSIQRIKSFAMREVIYSSIPYHTKSSVCLFGDFKLGSAAHSNGHTVLSLWYGEKVKCSAWAQESKNFDWLFMWLVVVSCSEKWNWSMWLVVMSCSEKWKWRQVSVGTWKSEV
jgi:hypothetical protein